MKIIATGLSGLVGSRVFELLKNTYEFESLSRSTGVDLANKTQVIDKIASSSAEVVLHLAAKTDVDGCEQDKIHGDKGEAWQVNVLGTDYIKTACEKSGKKLIYISTDFVFSGKDTPREGYTEEDKPVPINWYGQTKYEAEQLIQKSSIPWVVLRIAYPYRASFHRPDFVRSFVDAMRANRKVTAITDRTIMPTFIDDIAKAIDILIQTKSIGIYHAHGSQKLTFYDAVMLIAKVFNLDSSLIEKVTNDEYYLHRAKRPCNLSLKNDKIQRLGVIMRTFDEGLHELINQI